jgi:hypothetical protein
VNTNPVENPATCPPAREGQCEEKIIWAFDVDNGECCEYDGFCKSPEGWEQYKDLGTCEAVGTPPESDCPPAQDAECEEKQVWGHAKGIGDCCQYSGFCKIPDGFEQYKDEETCLAEIGQGSPLETCPEPGAGECEEKIVWAKTNDTGACCQYNGFCKIPNGLEQYKDKETCENEGQ